MYKLIAKLCFTYSYIMLLSPKHFNTKMALENKNCLLCNLRPLSPFRRNSKLSSSSLRKLSLKLKEKSH